MIICGIDPGLATTGVGIVDYTGNRFTVLHYSAIITKSSKTLSERLGQIHAELSEIIRSHSPEALAIESLFFNKNVSSAIHVGHARGVVLLVADQFGLSVTEYTPPQIKLAVSGYGRADKKQMQEMVKRLLKLQSVPKPDDVADGLAVSICHAHSHRIQSYT